ncbi:MAG: DivIVA domain-containing protein [Clostridia bacterium]|nr:DivIVA domain-containing protein [Clostridia bacterium]
MITAQDIENKVFKKAKIGGYDINDVEEFLEKLIIDYEQLTKDNTELSDKCENLQESVRYYKTLEQGIEQTISNAKEQADKIKEVALQEATNLKASQEISFQNKIAEYEGKIREKELQLEEIKKQMQIYKIKVQSMLEAQLKILNEDEE